MMKKTASLLAVLLLFALSGCGGAPESSSASFPFSASAGKANTVFRGASENVPESAPQTNAAIPVRGRWDGAQYTSEFIGLSFTLPEGWTASTDEEIAAVLGVGADILAEAGNSFTEEMLAIPNVYDMMALNLASGSNVFVLLENLAVQPLGILISASAYLDSVSQQIAEVEMELFRYVPGEPFEVELAAQKYEARQLAMQMEDGTVLGTQVYCARKIDGYMAVILVSAVGEDTPESIFTAFS
jgi:hypothetical protein